MVVKEELALPTLDAIDGHSLANTLRAMKPLDAPTVQAELSEEGVEEAEDGEMIENMAPPTEGEEPSARVVEERVGLEKWGTRREIRFGRGVYARNGRCAVRLTLDESVSKDLVIRPSDPQEILGNGMCEWRIAREDEDAELVVRVLSKPAVKWQFMVLIGTRTQLGSDPVSVAPGEAAVILDRLQSHAQWLAESLHALQAGPQLRMPGRPDPATYSRWLRTQQRDTERAIRHWTAVAQLCDTLAAAGEIELELTLVQPTEKP